MPITKNRAYVEQDAASRPLTLHAGDITLAVMCDFEEACIGFFESKDIEDKKQVKKILPGLKDTWICNWISSDQERICGLSFKEFMDEFHGAYLDKDWEETTCWELRGMVQGNNTFWDYVIRVQAQNSLLKSTLSHLDTEKLRHQLKAGIDDSLVRQCSNAKANREEDFKKWMGKVKWIDDMMRSEHHEFELIAKMNCESTCKSNPLGEPSNCTNVPMNKNVPCTSRNTVKLPKLTEGEHCLLFDNEGCLKCCRFFAGHHSTMCLNEWPSTANYRTLLQKDMDHTCPGAKAVTSIGVGVNPLPNFLCMLEFVLSFRGMRHANPDFHPQ
jgi:hypothetical protein